MLLQYLHAGLLFYHSKLRTFDLCFQLIIFYNLKELEDGLVGCIPYLLLITSVGFNMFVFCYIGENLTQAVRLFVIKRFFFQNTIAKIGAFLLQCESIADHVYEIDWYVLKKDDAKKVFTIIRISQIPVAITAGKIASMSIRTFAAVSKLLILKNKMIYKNFFYYYRL